MQRLKTLAPSFLRVSMGLVVLWFGMSQLLDAQAWIGFLPDFTASLPISQINLVYFNGAFEVIFSLLLILGFYTRWVALILALHLFDIAYIVGYDAIGVRDFGLALSTLTVFMQGEDALSLDARFKNRPL